MDRETWQAIVHGGTKSQTWLSTHTCTHIARQASHTHFISVQSCPTLWDPKDCSMPGFPVHHRLPELAQTHISQVSDAIQTSHPLSSPSPPAFNLGQHQGLLQWVSSSHQVAKVLEFQLQHQSFQWIFRTDFIYSWLDGCCSPRDSQESSPTLQLKASVLRCSAFFTVQLSHPYMTTGKTIALTRWTFIGKVVSLLFNMQSSFDIAFLPRSKCLLILWLQSPPAVILEPQNTKSLTVSIVSPSICHEVMGLDAMILVFWMLSFKPDFSLSFSTFIKKFFSSSSLYTIKEVSSAYSLQSWFQLMLHPAQHFAWCTLHIS